MADATQTRPKAIESRTIDWIPQSERHGNPRSLFAIWFAANTSITALVTGALFVTLGNTPFWAIVAIIAGNVVGGYITALHSAQGPRLGVPQMIQSRAQFGYYGAILPLVLALLIYLGFYATGLVLGGQAIASLLHLPQQVGSAVFAVCSTLLAVFGYRWIHRFSRVASVVSGIVFVVLLVIVLAGPRRTELFHSDAFAMAPFVLGLSLSASWQLTFGPYIADYSRYLPESSSQRATIWWTFGGSVLGASLAMTLGAFAAALGRNAFYDSEVGYVAGLAGTFAWVVLITVVLGKLTGNTLSSYGGFMSLATIVTALTRRQLVGRRGRTVYVVIISLIAYGIAATATSNFLATFQNFLLFLLYFMTPWSAINLVDYYLVRRKHYDIDALFDPNGAYGKVNIAAFIAYFVGVAIQIPFMNSSLYVGPIASLLGGAEIAWIIGLIVAGIVYYLLTPALRATRSALPNSHSLLLEQNERTP